MKRIKMLIGIAILWIAAFSASAQPPIVKMAIDSTHILIGQQTRIHVEISAGKDLSLQLPVVVDTLMKGVEVLETSKIDTAEIGNNHIRLKYDYLVTSFDSALYLLPPLKVIAGIDTAYSNELALKVSTLPVDTETKQFYDIKGVLKPKFVLMDYLLIPLLIYGGLLVLALIAVVIYRLVKKKSLLPFRNEKPYVLPHVRAIGKLDEIKLQKLWQQGKIKFYHSEITDTLRSYIDERFGIGAMEMTSGEILDAIKKYNEADSSVDHLKQILVLSDFVKFAKYNPLPDENELSLMNAYLFVNNTKKEELQTEENKENKENEISL